ALYQRDLHSFPTRRSSDLENFAVLRRNVEANRYVNVVCIPKAVAQQNATSRMYLSRFCGSHSLVGEPVEYRGEFLDVETVRLDRSEEHTSELQSPCNLVCR